MGTVFCAHGFLLISHPRGHKSTAHPTELLADIKFIFVFYLRVFAENIVFSVFSIKS